MLGHIGVNGSDALVAKGCFVSYAMVGAGVLWEATYMGSIIEQRNAIGFMIKVGHKTNYT